MVLKVEFRLSNRGGGGIRGKGTETRRMKERGEVSKTAPLSSSSFLYFLNLVRWYTHRGTGSAESWMVERWSDQNKSDRFLAKYTLKITTKLAIFYQLLFGGVYPRNSREIGQFFLNLSLKIPRNLTFSSATCQKPCLKINASSVRWSFYLFSTTVLLINMYWYCCWSILGLERLTSPCSNISKERVRLNKKCVQTFFCDMNSS